MNFYKTLGLKNSRIDVADGPFEGIWKKLTWIKF